MSPDVIYMDEPLGALDSVTRLQMRGEVLRIWQQERPARPCSSPNGWWS